MHLFLYFQIDLPLTTDREELINHADLFVMVYSITDNKSFIEVKKILKIIQDIRHSTSNSNPIYALIGNKKDLQHFRQVDYDDGEKLAKRYGCPFFELSEDYTETNKVFQEVIRHVLHKKSREETSQAKKRQNSYSSIYRGLEKEKGQRESKEKKSGSLSDMSTGTYTALTVA